MLRWNLTQRTSVQDPRCRLHIFENSTLVDDKEIGLEVFVQERAFTELGVLAE